MRDGEGVVYIGVKGGCLEESLVVECGGARGKSGDAECLGRPSVDCVRALRCSSWEVLWNPAHPSKLCPCDTHSISWLNFLKFSPGPTFECQRHHRPRLECIHRTIRQLHPISRQIPHCWVPMFNNYCGVHQRGRHVRQRLVTNLIQPKRIATRARRVDCEDMPSSTLAGALAEVPVVDGRCPRIGDVESNVVDGTGPGGVENSGCVCYSACPNHPQPCT